MRRTDYLIDGDREMTMFLTAAKQNRREGRVICVRTKDGGLTWQLISHVGPEPAGNEFTTMPSSVRLSEGTILTAVRRRSDIALWRTEDDGRSWHDAGIPVADTGRGNPPSLIRMKDGRLVLTWGLRAKPYSIRAKVSTDAGKTWSQDLVVREDGGSWDIGYTRTAQRVDGRLVTVYYYALRDDAEKFIAATIWDPDNVTRAAE